MHAPHRGCLTRRCTCAAGGRDRPAPQVSHVAIDAPRPGLASGRAANVHGSASEPTNDSRGARPGITHPHTRGHMHAERAMPPCNLRGERPSNPLTTSDVANRPPLSRACRHSCSEWHCATCCAAGCVLVVTGRQPIQSAPIPTYRICTNHWLHYVGCMPPPTVPIRICATPLHTAPLNIFISASRCYRAEQPPRWGTEVGPEAPGAKQA